MNTSYKLRNVERFTRFVLGFSIILSILIIPLTSTGIAVACALAVYPLITSLIAIDPVFFLFHQFNKTTSFATRGRVDVAV